MIVISGHFDDTSSKKVTSHEKYRYHRILYLPLDSEPFFDMRSYEMLRPRDNQIN